MRLYYVSLLVVLSAGLCAGEKLVNTYKLDSSGQSYQLTLKDNWGFELTGPNGQQVKGTYVATDRKIGLLAGKLLRHFEYKVQNGDLLLRPSTTDGPEPNDVLGQMPPVNRSEAFTAYLTSNHHKQKHASRPVAQPPVTHQPITQPVATAHPLTMDQLLTQARIDSQYHAYMAAGTKALSEKKFPEARAHFILASRFKPNAPGARDHIAMCDGAQALSEGDTARKRGDLRTAHRAYTRAKQTCPALSKIADAQLGTIRVFHPGARRSYGRRHTTELDRNIAQHVEQGRSADALQLATNALRSDPNSLRLRTMKEGLEGLQTAEGLYGNLRNILNRAQRKCDVIQKVEPMAGQTAKWRTQLATQSQQIDTRLTAARSRFAQNVYAGLGATLTDARASATASAQLLNQARAAYAAKAAAVDNEDKVDLPFVTIRTGKQSERVKRLNSYAESFRAFSVEASALAK